MKRSLFCAALGGLSGVVLGALGAHTLGGELAARGTAAAWETAVLYQLVHSVAALATALFSQARPEGDRDHCPWIARAGAVWLAGVFLFSGSLYVLALGGPRWLGPVTPLGGVFLLLGWGCILMAARNRTAAAPSMAMVVDLPDDLRRVLDAVRRVGRPRLAGGCVRDRLMGRTPKDYDIEVRGVDFETLRTVLTPFGATDVVGRSFGVIKLRLASGEYDFSLPRRESKTGAGHRGFAVAPDPDLSDTDAAARRDFTINAITCDPFTGELFDPHGGQRDLAARVLRHTGPAFVEDPLRVLRAFQFAARFDFTLAPETAALCHEIADTFAELPVERVWAEWDKWATQSTRPSRGLAVLEETGWLAHFPELAALRGTPQDPEWHPEGDAFTHTAHCCDALVALPAWRDAAPDRRRILLFAVLAHDFGKPTTTHQAEKHGRLRWVSPGHESTGGPLAETFLTRIGAPRALAHTVRPLVVAHMAHHSGGGEFSDTAVRRLARRLHPATIDELCAVMMADSLGRPPLHSPETLDLIEKLRARSRALDLQSHAPRPLLLGRHLLAAGLPVGPAFTPLLAAAFEAQLDGAFTDEPSALAWLADYLRERHGTKS